MLRGMQRIIIRPSARDRYQVVELAVIEVPCQSDFVSVAEAKAWAIVHFPAAVIIVDGEQIDPDGIAYGVVR